MPATAIIDADEARVHNLAISAVYSGHEVFVGTTSPYSSASLRNLGAIELVHRASLNPEKSGGWLYLWFSFLSALRIKPSVVHFHGLPAPLFARLIAFFYPETTLIWTVSSLANWSTFRVRLFSFFTGGVFDGITTPSRQLQYRLLVEYGIKALYVPDGYEIPLLEDIPARNFGLRKGQYVFALAQDRKTCAWTVKAYNNTSTRKQLVFGVYKKEAWQTSLERRHSFVRFIQISPGRAFTSLIRQSHALLALDLKTPTWALLLAMETKLPVVAITNPLYEETLGTAGLFTASFDVAELEDILHAVIKRDAPLTVRQKLYLGAKRARGHFTRERIWQEYLPLYYYPAVRYVPMDSVQRMPHVRIS